jgi:hypothetical protein
VLIKELILLVFTMVVERVLRSISRFLTILVKKGGLKEAAFPFIEVRN